MTNYRHAQMKSIIGAIDSPKLAVHPERCLLVRNRNANCLHCAQVCTTKAISLSSEGVAVNPELCIGCGTCATACPSGCLEATHPSDAQLLDAAQTVLGTTGGRLAFICETAWSAHHTASKGQSAERSTCEGAPNPDGTHDFEPGGVMGTTADGTPVLGVVCLGRVEESLLVEVTARGAQSVKLISGHCEACAHHAGGTLCNAIVTSAENLLEAVGISSPLVRMRQDDARGLRVTSNETSVVTPPQKHHLSSQKSKTEHNASQSQASRSRPRQRTALVRGANKSFTPEFPHVQADGTLPHFVPERRLRLFNSLKAIGSPCKRTVATRLWGQIDINTELCRSCRMCTVFCPTGAVSRFDADDGSFGVEHRSTLCMQCRLCETICPEQAITVSSNVSLNEFIAGKKFRFPMQPLGWNPGKEDAIASRMARFIKVDNVQEPQAKVKTGDTAERRAYAQKREAQRREIRSRPDAR